MTDPLPIPLRYLEGTDNRALDLVVVVPVARCEWHLAVKLLGWIKALGGVPCPLMVYCAPGIDSTLMAILGNTYGDGCTVARADFVDPGYFGGANLMFNGALDYCERAHPGRAMLWVECDCVPTRAFWVDEILDEYRACGQPFMGDVHLCAVNHMTGNGVWHPNWRTISPMLAALPGPDPEWGWDSACADETFTRCHRARTIQQIWRPELPITEEWADANIRTNVALFHQVKDGSLIDILCRQQGRTLIPLPAQLEKSTYDKGRQTPSPFAAKLTPPQRMIAGIPAPEPNMPGVELFYVTFRRDIEFLRYSLRSVEKYARGFSGVTVVVPESERGLYDWAKKVRMVYLPEPEGKGFLWHMAMKCMADEICPNAQAIVHMDADVMFWQPAVPGDFFRDGKPIIVRERYADLKNPNRRLWQIAVELAIGAKPEFETMVCQPPVHICDVYAKTRRLVEEFTGNRFMDYVLSCRGEFPQSFCELNCIGHVALTRFRDRYAPVDYDPQRDNKECGVADGQHQYLYRRDRNKVCETWSRGGIDRYKSDIEAWLRGAVPEYFIK